MKIKLETNRLILRPWEIKDAPKMFSSWASDSEVTKYVTWNPHESVEVTKDLINQWIKEYEKPERINFAIVLKENNELIGAIEVVGYLDGVPVIGYTLARKYWNNGYMSEACRCVRDYLFSIGHTKIRIDAVIDNIGSNKVIQKCNGVFIKQEIVERELKKDKVITNCYIIYKPKEEE